MSDRAGVNSSAAPGQHPVVERYLAGERTLEQLRESVGRLGTPLLGEVVDGACDVTFVIIDDAVGESAFRCGA